MTSRGGVVALLFTDIVGSTELLSRLGDNATDELRRRHFAALARALEALGRALRSSDPAAAREAYDGAIALFDACGAVWRRDRALDARP